MTEIDAIIQEIQAAARVLDQRTQQQNAGQVLQILLRLTWQVKQLQERPV